MCKTNFFPLLLIAISQFIKPLNIELNSKSTRNLGYDQCNMLTNGELHVLSHFIKPSMVIFDIGAHVGDWTQEIIALNRQSTIYAFEPITSNFNKLEKRYAKNSYVLTHNFALSNRNTRLNMFTYDGHSPSKLSSFYYRPILDKILETKPYTIEVETIMLDHFSKNHKVNHIDYLKIDTEGAELAILQGAKDMLSKEAIDYIQFEYGGTYTDAHTTLKDVYNLLSECHFHIFKIIPNGLIYIPEWDSQLENYRYSNYIAVHSKKIYELLTQN